ncbi:MAG: DegT/DnrJ/EryC1/StrS family aminotransferase [Bacteroidales bacterium]|nr:DegT/DnrJ/EryC1/StrS family aminotransferase [Bacteroidales bacterium]
MVDLFSQYLKIKEKVDYSIQEIINKSEFIKGSKVKDFEQNLSKYLGVGNVITCGNGTDALQIALMSLNLKPGDEIITTPFTFIATAEVISLLGLKTVLVDVESDTFLINANKIESAITKKTKAIIPVHLFGQIAEMDKIIEIAKQNKIFIIEDAAQSLGGTFDLNNIQLHSGCIGDIGCTSFFPSKNLGCFGDGGAIFTNNNEIAEKIKMISNHGMKTRYYHDIIGVNSRLDTIQAAVLDIKLQYLNEYIRSRKEVAQKYNSDLNGIRQISTPSIKRDHVFHQYTLFINDNSRDALKEYLESNSIPSMIYYPVPLHLQKAFLNLGYKKGDFPISENLCDHVLSLPMHTELNESQLDYITQTIREFYDKR